MAALTPVSVKVHASDFDVAVLQSTLLAGSGNEGAVVAFTGYVRCTNQERPVYKLELEHYPGMTEASITKIAQQAAERWPLLAISVVHRIGKLSPGDPIVWVGVSSAHREAAFSACEYIMDYLKTRAPFWKKELGPEGEHWVAARDQDGQRAARWDEDSTP